jgi:hypothetical protein
VLASMRLPTPRVRGVGVQQTRLRNQANWGSDERDAAQRIRQAGGSTKAKSRRWLTKRLHDLGIGGKADGDGHGVSSPPSVSSQSTMGSRVGEVGSVRLGSEQPGCLAWVPPHQFCPSGKTGRGPSCRRLAEGLELRPEPRVSGAWSVAWASLLEGSMQVGCAPCVVLSFICFTAVSRSLGPQEGDEARDAAALSASPSGRQAEGIPVKVHVHRKPMKEFADLRIIQVRLAPGGGGLGFCGASGVAFAAVHVRAALSETPGDVRTPPWWAQGLSFHHLLLGKGSARFAADTVALWVGRCHVRNAVEPRSGSEPYHAFPPLACASRAKICLKTPRG